MNWKIEDLEQGVSEFQLSDTTTLIYQGNIGDVMFFIDKKDGSSYNYGIKDVINNKLPLITPPKRGWKDLTIDEAFVLIKSKKKVWFYDNKKQKSGKNIIDGFNLHNINGFSYFIVGTRFNHASMYDDNGRPADDYEGLGL